MREDTFTNTAADAGRYDFATFPQPGRPRGAATPPRPPLDCGHEPVRVGGRFTGNCARGRNCPNSGWTTHWPADGGGVHPGTVEDCAACGGGS